MSECSISFKPLYYRRYVDATFHVISDPAHVPLFLEYINSKHPNINFTCDIEKDFKLPFLDILITRHNGKLFTSVYRKSTFTGLGLNYLSFSPILHKINSIRTLINRAYNVCSDFNLFHLDMTFLLNYFIDNAYPEFQFYRILNRFLNDKFEPKPVVTTVKKDIRYVKLPYLGHVSYDVRKKLQVVLRDTFPQVKFQFVFTNNFTISSLLKDRSSLPKDLNANIAYSFTCAHCGMRYIGSTTRWFKHRILEHRGLSFRTGFPLSKPSFSAVRQHSHDHDHPFTNRDFEILTFASNRLDLVISESILIRKMKPELNNHLSAFQLALE